MGQYRRPGSTAFKTWLGDHTESQIGLPIIPAGTHPHQAWQSQLLNFLYHLHQLHPLQLPIKTHSLPSASTEHICQSFYSKNASMLWHFFSFIIVVAQLANTKMVDQISALQLDFSSHTCWPPITLFSILPLVSECLFCLKLSTYLFQPHVTY